MKIATNRASSQTKKARKKRSCSSVLHVPSTSKTRKTPARGPTSAVGTAKFSSPTFATSSSSSISSPASRASESDETAGCGSGVIAIDIYVDVTQSDFDVQFDKQDASGVSVVISPLSEEKGQGEPILSTKQFVADLLLDEKTEKDVEMLSLNNVDITRRALSEDIGTTSPFGSPNISIGGFGHFLGKAAKKISLNDADDDQMQQEREIANDSLTTITDDISTTDETATAESDRKDPDDYLSNVNNNNNQLEQAAFTNDRDGLLEEKC